VAGGGLGGGVGGLGFGLPGGGTPGWDGVGGSTTVLDWGDESPPLEQAAKKKVRNTTSTVIA